MSGESKVRQQAEEPVSDRRGEPRAPIHLRVEYGRLNAFFADYTRNIGRGGTFIRTRKPLPIGTEFEFSLHVPHLSEPLKLRGRVQWCASPEEAEAQGREPGMGIGFLFDSEADRLRVEGTVERLMVEAFGRDLYERLREEMRRQPVPPRRSGSSPGSDGTTP